MTERLTVKSEMTKEEEQRIAVADAVYGVAGLLVLVTGYFRVTVYGKGWEFYSHEPIFWLKMILVSVMGAASFFPTTKIIQRSVKLNSEGSIAPMGERLASRMTSIINAELLAIASIPLAAALMARGVGYADWFPWQAGAAGVAVALGGLGFKYVKEGAHDGSLRTSSPPFGRLPHPADVFFPTVARPPSPSPCRMHNLTPTPNAFACECPSVSALDWKDEFE